MSKLDRKATTVDRVKIEKVPDDKHGGFLGDLIRLIPDSLGIDPFLIYKTSKRKKHELKLDAEKNDSWREIYRLFVAHLILVSSLHLITLGCCRMLLGRWQTGIRNDPSKTLEDSWISELLEQLTAALGDVLMQTPRLSCFFYINSLLSVQILMVLVPIYYARCSPMDTSVVRFLLRPKLEAMQATRQTLKDLHSIERSIVQTHLSQLHLDRKFGNHPLPESKMPGDLQAIQVQERQLCLVRLVDANDTQVALLRPTYYSRIYHEQLIRFAFYFILVAAICLVNSYIFVCIASLLIVDTSITGEIPMEILRQFKLFVVFRLLNWRQILVLLEVLTLALATCGATISFISMFVLQTKRHIDMIVSMQVELNSFLTHLHDKSAAAYMPDRTLTDLRLLRISTRFNSFRLDSSRSARVMSQLLTAIVSVSLIFSTTTLITRLFIQVDAHFDLQIPILCIIWSCTNMYTVACSILPPLTEKIQRILWSILAEQTNHSRKTNSPIHSDPLVSLWHRQALNYGFISNLYFVYVFGIGITYGRVLQINFFLVSVITWAGKH